MQQSSQSKVVTISGSYSENFVPPPDRVIQPSQESNDGSKTPINQVLNQLPPGSYHGEIRNMGDEVMRKLDDQLQTIDGDMKPDGTKNETEQAADNSSKSSDNQDGGDNSSTADKPGDDAKQAQDASKPSPVSGRTRKHLQPDQQQTQDETTTGDPKITKPGSKATRKKN